MSSFLFLSARILRLNKESLEEYLAKYPHWVPDENSVFLSQGSYALGEIGTKVPISKCHTGLVTRPILGIFSCFDNMKSRKELMDGLASRASRISDINTMFYKLRSLDAKETTPNVPVFIDGRTTPESGFIYCVPLNDHDRIKKYYDTLEEDELMEDLPCSMKATSHNGAIIASMMTAIFLNHYYNLLFNDNIRDVPYKLEYSLPIISLKTDY